MNKYNEILQLFVSDDELRQNLLQPFVIGKRAYATDAHALVFFDAALLPTDYVMPAPLGTPPDVNNVIPAGFNMDEVLRLGLLQRAMDICPKITEPVMNEEERQCTECNGSGKVDFDYDDRNWETHTIEGDCPICDGEGTITTEIPTGKTETYMDYEQQIQIRNSFFSMLLIEKLAKVAEILNEQKIYLKYQDNPVKGSLFRILDVYVLLMPMMQTTDIKPLCTILPIS